MILASRRGEQKEDIYLGGNHIAQARWRIRSERCSAFPEVPSGVSLTKLKKKKKFYMENFNRTQAL